MDAYARAATLRVGGGQVLRLREIVAILPAAGEPGVKTRILLASGRVILSTVSAATLQKRASGGHVLSAGCLR